MSASRTDHVQTRREFLAAVSTAWMGGLAYTIPSFAQAQQPPVTSFKALRGGVGIFTGRGGTIGWFISEDAIGVVDSQYPDTAKICLDGITQRAGYRPIECLMITHHHGDHTAGNGIFRPTTRRDVTWPASSSQPPSGRLLRITTRCLCRTSPANSRR